VPRSVHQSSLIPCSKREYLLAQLRQKEAIIDSLLKQIHNPTHQTPLNLALPSGPSLPAHSTVSPEPAAHKDVLAWIEKIEGACASVRTAGGGGGAGAFRLDARAEPDEAFDDEAEDDDGAGAGEGDLVENEVEAEEPGDKEKKSKSKLHSLPEEAAPLGLIANLSLRKTRRVLVRRWPYGGCVSYFLCSEPHVHRREYTALSQLLCISLLKTRLFAGLVFIS
jgi:hypothetical protein